MISLNPMAIAIPAKYNNAINSALAIANQAGINNIWNHDILEANLQPPDVSLLKELQKYIKSELVKKLGHYCTYCLTFRISEGDFHLDHFVIKSTTKPFARFSYHVNNLLLSCDSCNRGKDVKLVYDEVSTALAVLQNCAYKDIPFTVFHPYLHPLGENFKFSHNTVEAVSDLGLQYLSLINFYDAANAAQILNNLKIRKKNLSDDQMANVKIIMKRKRLKKRA